MKPAILFLILLLQGSFLLSQTIDLPETERDLILEFQNYRSSDYDTRFDSLRPKLRNRVADVLSNTNSFQHPFDSLSKSIKVLKSADNRVRIFSWDELTGGTWHDMAVMVQFKAADNSIRTQWIDSDISEEPNGFVSSIQFEIHHLEINQRHHYLCFGWGTYGSGHHHNSILIFSIENDAISVCTTCIDEEFTTIMAPRSAKIAIEYNETAKEISFAEFKLDDEIGFYEATGNRIRLKLQQGKFKLMED